MYGTYFLESRRFYTNSLVFRRQEPLIGIAKTIMCKILYNRIGKLLEKKRHKSKWQRSIHDVCETFHFSFSFLAAYQTGRKYLMTKSNIIKKKQILWGAYNTQENI